MAESPESLPQTYRDFAARFPELAGAHEVIGEAVAAAGPLDARTCELIKIGICLGAGRESALKAHVRRARRAGAGVDEIEQAIALGMTSVGWSATVAGWRWAHDQFERDVAEG